MKKTTLPLFINHTEPLIHSIHPPANQDTQLSPFFPSQTPITPCSHAKTPGRKGSALRRWDLARLAHIPHRTRTTARKREKQVPGSAALWAPRYIHRIKAAAAAAAALYGRFLIAGCPGISVAAYCSPRARGDCCISTYTLSCD